MLWSPRFLIRMQDAIVNLKQTIKMFKQKLDTILNPMNTL